MAIYSFSAEVFSRSKGHRVTAAAAYRAGSVIRDETIGERFDYTRKRGILYSEIIGPDHAPAFMLDREQLWNAVEAQEKRSDSQLAREALLAIPHELDQSDQLALLRGFVREEFVARGMVADFSVHAPNRDGDDRNVHAHVMLTMRPIEGDRFGKKARQWNSDELLIHWREAWADHCNIALEEAGFDARVDHRSLEAQGIDRIPGEHLGKAATAMERRGEDSPRGDRQRAIDTRNAELDQLVAEYEEIDAQLRREEERRLDARFGLADPDQPEYGQEWEEESVTAGEEVPPRTAAEEQAQLDADAAPFADQMARDGEIHQDGLALGWWEQGAAFVAHLYDQTRAALRAFWKNRLESPGTVARRSAEPVPERDR